MTYAKTNNLLSTNNSKTIKGEKLGYTTYIMYLAPHTQNSKNINVCSHASKGCATACLFKSGAARFDQVQQGKVDKTEWFLDNRVEFLNKLDNEIKNIVARHEAIEGEKVLKKNGDVLRFKNFAIRLNGTSDLPFEKYKIRDGKNIFELYPSVQFYDYTKNPIRFEKEFDNYHLTFSQSEDNQAKALELLSSGKNVAVVFAVKKEANLPNEYQGFKVINGDESDLRFLDDSNVVVGLKYKLLTGKGTSGINKANMEANPFLVQV
jgi:hypothetical protein